VDSINWVLRKGQGSANDACGMRPAGYGLGNNAWEIRLAFLGLVNLLARKFSIIGAGGVRIIRDENDELCDWNGLAHDVIHITV
jgi:hypothetical protein